MVKFELKMNKYGQLYIPKELRSELGSELEALADARTSVMFRRGLKARDVLESLRVIMADLEHRAKLEEEVNQHGED